MHQPGPSPSANDGSNTHPKDQALEGHPEVRKYDELKYGQTYAPAQVPAQPPVSVTERLGRFFRTDDSSFWTGMLIGGVATFVLTSDTVKRAIVKSFAKVSDETKEGVKKVKKAVAKEKEPTKAEKAEKK